MPRKGYRSITVKEAVHCQLEKIAETTFRTVPEVIKYLIEEQSIMKEA